MSSKALQTDYTKTSDLHFMKLDKKASMRKGN